ncbi:MAG: hypothetical protein JWM31_1779, partial [Solirubrobacterales bacterium]|nr:hypothetical protein [Solirubrobacterales bacterium]
LSGGMAAARAIAAAGGVEPAVVSLQDLHGPSRPPVVRPGATA